MLNFKEINGIFIEMFGKEKLLLDIYIFINIKIKLLLQKNYNYLNKNIYIYMFAEFNDTMFPYIRINLNLDDINNESFNQFTQKWESYDETKYSIYFYISSER